MPIHDWTRVDSGLFHAFHRGWTCALCDALNARALPGDNFALLEPSIQPTVPDSLTLSLSRREMECPIGGASALAVADAPPRARHVQRREAGVYARKADRVTVRHRHGQVVAVIEIVSPGNKESTAELRAFVQKAADLIQQGVHLLVIDLHPPTKRDPRGIHGEIWDEIAGDEFELPPDKPLTLAAYDAGPIQVAYVEPVAVGDALPDMPLFLQPERYILTPLEATYQTTWDVFPNALKGLLES